MSRPKIVRVSIAVAVLALCSFAGFANLHAQAPSPQPNFLVLPQALSFTAVQGGASPPPQTLWLINTGASTMEWSALIGFLPGSGPLTAGPLMTAASNTTPTIAEVSMDTTGLTAGTYNFIFQFFATSTLYEGAFFVFTPSIPVTVTVTPPAPPQFVLTPAEIVLNIPTLSTETAARTVNVQNAGSGSLSWTATADTGGDGPWLSVQPSSSGSTATVVADLAGMSPGQYLGAVHFSGTASNTAGNAAPAPAAVNVVANLTGQPDLVSDVSGLQFDLASDEGAIVPDATINAAFSSGAPLANPIPFTISVDQAEGQNWLQVSSSMGVTGTRFNVSANPSGLAPGHYVAYLSVTSPAARNALSIPVALNLNDARQPGEIEVSPSGVLLAATLAAAPVTQPVLVYSNGAQFTWTAATAELSAPTNSAPGSWLSISRTSGNNLGSLSVSADPSGITTAGVYTGQVVITATGTLNPSLIIPVTFVVSGGSGNAALSAIQTVQPADQFVAFAGVPMSLEATQVSSGATPSGLVEVSFSSGDPTVTLTDEGSGFYYGSWIPATTGPVALSFSSAAGIAIISGAVMSPAIQVPVLRAVTGAASFTPGAPISPGDFAVLWGDNLSAQTVPASMLPLQSSLGGVSVTINGIAAPLLYVSATQINLQVPSELAGQTSALIKLTSANGVAEMADVPAIAHLSGVPVSTAAPAQAGETLMLFCSGLGVTVVNPPPDGAGAPLNPLAMTQFTPLVTVGGSQAQVLFSGLSPGSVALDQINFIVPPGLPSGVVPLNVALGLVSNSTALAVR